MNHKLSAQVSMAAASTAIPFRFKGGPSTTQVSFHHRRSSLSAHKPFKSRHATKNELKEAAKGKINGKTAKGKRSSPHQQVMSKLDRKNKAKQIRQTREEKNTKATSVFAGASGAPRIVAILPLSPEVDTHRAIQSLSDAADAHAQWPLGGQIRVRSDKFKQNLIFLPVRMSMIDALDGCRAADIVVLILSARDAPGDHAQSLIKAVESQGVSDIVTMVQDYDSMTLAGKRGEWPGGYSGLKAWMTQYLPQQNKAWNLDSFGECTNAVRSLCQTVPAGVHWRNDRSWMLVEDVEWPLVAEHRQSGTCEVVVTGVIRGKCLKADRLVQVGDWGHFQVEKTTSAKLPMVKKRKANEMILDQYNEPASILREPGVDQETLDELAPHEASMDSIGDIDPGSQSRRKGVLLDGHDYFSDEEDVDATPAPKRVPRGTSNYQAAWYIGDETDSDSDSNDPTDEDGDIQMDPLSAPQVTSDLTGLAEPETEDVVSEPEVFFNPSPTQEAAQIEEYRKSHKEKAKEDADFPDEIELQPNVLARERLAQYRGLKDFKSSEWDVSEDRPYEPQDWQRLLPVDNYKNAYKQAERDALVGGVPAGTRVHVHLRSVPVSRQQTYTPAQPLTLHSLLQHEHKRSVINVQIRLATTHLHPVKSKDDLIVQIGYRRFCINPLFSVQGATKNDVHKFLRYLHPGQTAVASFMAPVTWGSVPVLFFQRSSSGSLDLIGTGTTLPPSTSRVIAKRAILTGHPYKINPKVVTVRYMFFNKEDVLWFKALQLWTKWKRSGFIKESLGTHGYFKANFDKQLNPQDTVAVSLYKRVWPRLARPVAVDELRDVEEEKVVKMERDPVLKVEEVMKMEE